MARPLNDSVFLYGFHDPGGEQIMLDVGITGWVIITEAIGHDPNDRSGRNYRPFTDRGLGVIVRLNNAYNPGGTLPFERDYPDFARRCANFVAASQGAHLWIIGNEPNHPIEWPGAQWNWGPGWPTPISPETRGEEITPTRYAACFKQCRTAIKAAAGHGQDQVLVAPPAPWNILLTYPTNPDGDWVRYFADLLKTIGAGNLDGIVLHTYTHGSSPTLIPSEEKLKDPRFCNYHWHFRAYQDFMNVIPTAMRALPVYITETNQGDEPWLNANNGWVRAAYAEIDRWNRSGKQLVRSLLLYRWPQVPGDRWGIEGKAGVIEDFKQALGPRYMWTTAEDPDELNVVDKIGKLPQGPTPYPKRDPNNIRRIVVHHTVTPDNITPERLAQAAVQRGLPGITYHYLISGDGTVYATQPPDSLIRQTNRQNVNSDGLGVALAGNFTHAVPTEAQMKSAALLIRDLLNRFNLPVSSVVGAREVAQTASPGNQWLSGARYKDALITRINALVTPEAIR